jgi:hypothetical protein
MIHHVANGNPTPQTTAQVNANAFTSSFISASRK